jgi:hypothetical protein
MASRRSLVQTTEHVTPSSYAKLNGANASLTRTAVEIKQNSRLRLRRHSVLVFSTTRTAATFLSSMKALLGRGDSLGSLMLRSNGRS